MLRALLLLPSLLGAALASPVRGPQECAKGPAVWCQDLQAAARCGAVGHCQSTIWSKPAIRSLPCDVCLDVVAAAGNGLNPNATETDTLALLNKTCEWLPSQESSTKCQEMVDTHSMVVLNMLQGVPDGAPAQVCAALALCQPLQGLTDTAGPLSGEDAPEVLDPFMANGPLSFHPLQIPEDPVCQNCIHLVTQLRDAVGSNLSNLAEAATQEQCKPLGPGLAPLCESYILQYLAPAEQMRRLILPEETCGQGGFCESLQGRAAGGAPSLEPVSPRKKSEVQMKSDLTCEVCLQVIEVLDQWLDSNSTEALIGRALERVCSVMPKRIVQQCVTMVDTYTPALVQFVSRAPPEKVCQAIRLCGGRRQARAIHRARVTTPSPLLDVDNQGTFCGGCRRLLGVSSSNLERKSTQHGILRAFKGGCAILPLPYMIQCSRFVDEYEPVLIATLRDMMDPTALCAKVGACHPPRAPLLGTDQCVMGPRFWCSSQEAAEMCNAVEHCQRHMWKAARFHTERN